VAAAVGVENGGVCRRSSGGDSLMKAAKATRSAGMYQWRIGISAWRNT